MAGEMPELTKTPIGKAIVNKMQIEDFEILLKKEDPFFEDQKGNTYLHLIAVIGRPALFHALAATGICVNQRNKRNQTALELSGIHGQPLHVADLVAYGADPQILSSSLLNESGNSKNPLWKKAWSHVQPGMWRAVRDNDSKTVERLMGLWCKTEIAQTDITYKHRKRIVKVVQTLRQSASPHPALVDLLDTYRFTMILIYGVLENDINIMKYALDRKPCDVNHLKQGSSKPHILQYVLHRPNLEMVELLCTPCIPGSFEEHTVVNPNIMVTINHLFRAPLYFDIFHDNIREDIREVVLSLPMDMSLRDEYGRCCLTYALDATHGELNIKTAQHFLDRGLDVSMRDQTGASARDVAMFNGRRDIVSLIDKLMVKYIRGSDTETLERFALESYDAFQVEHNGRDSFILAHGNETKDVVQFLEWLPKFQHEVRTLHSACIHGSQTSVQQCLDASTRAEMLLKAKDKGGRNCLHLAVLYDKIDVVRYLLENRYIESSILLHSTNCVGVTAIDIAHSYPNSTYTDLIGGTSSNQLRRRVNLVKERQRSFTLDRELRCLKKYDELREIITQHDGSAKEFSETLRQFKLCPVSKMNELLCPRGITLVKHYEELLILAMNHNKEDIAIRLVDLGAFPFTQESLTVPVDGDMKNEEIYHLAIDLGMTKLGRLLLKKMTKLGRDISHLISNEKPNDADIVITNSPMDQIDGN